MHYAPMRQESAGSKRYIASEQVLSVTLDIVLKSTNITQVREASDDTRCRTEVKKSEV
jgi:hypothetical protein